MKSWYVLYVNSRAEKKVAACLRMNGWEVFSPLKTEWRQWSDRKKKITVPYFHSYVFVRFNYETERIKLLQTPSVVRILFWLGQPAIIRDKEMEAIQNFFSNNAHQEIYCESLTKGAAYQIKDGLLQGKSGIVIWQNSDRALLEIPELNLRFNVRKDRLIKDSC